MIRTITFVLAVILVTGPVHIAAKAPRGSWDELRPLVGSEIAVKTGSGETIYGILRAVEDDTLKVEPVDRKGRSGTARMIAREETRRVWRAQLRSGGRKIAKGALVGLGAGAVAGTGVYLGTRDDEPDGQAIFNIPALMIYGAGIGALVGFFVKKSHRKTELVYSV